MKHPFYQQLKYNEGWQKGKLQSQLTIQNQLELRKKSYYKNPVRCKYCNEPISYEKVHSTTPKPIFCSKSCSAKYNNKLRKHTLATKNKIRATMQTKYPNGTYHALPSLCVIKEKDFHVIGRHSKIQYVYCIVCGKLLCQSVSSPRKTCSVMCTRKTFSINAKKNKLGGNFNKRSFWYVSPFAGKVHLESTYELKLAKLLDANSISWLRPKRGFTWIDPDFKEHKYYPDFYLQNQDLYIDTKNSYLQELHKTKIDFVRKNHAIKLLILDLHEITLENILAR